MVPAASLKRAASHRSVDSKARRVKRSRSGASRAHRIARGRCRRRPTYCLDSELRLSWRPGNSRKCLRHRRRRIHRIFRLRRPGFQAAAAARFQASAVSRFWASAACGLSAAAAAGLQASSASETLIPASDSSPRQLSRAYWAWIAVCVSWGTTFLATRVAIESIPPFAMAGPRHFIAGIVLALILRTRGIKLPSRDSWGGHALLGLLMIGFGNGCLVWAQQFVPSGVAAVLVSVIPFWMIGVEAFMPGGEPIRQATGARPAPRLRRHRPADELEHERQRADASDRARRHHDAAVVPRLGDRLGVCEAAQARRKSVCGDGRADHVRRRRPDGRRDHHWRVGATWRRRHAA